MFTILSGLLVWSNIKKIKINFLVVVLLFSLLPILSIFRPGVYESGDHRWHSAWLMSFYSSIEDGNIIPRWTDDICSGFGCPNFNYYYRGPYYLGSIFHAIGFSFVDSIKAVLFTSYLLSGLTMYLWLKEEFDKDVAMVGAILYQFAPYHFVSMHFRNTIGETLAFALIPLVLFTSIKLKQKTSLVYFLSFSLSLYFLIITHIAISLTFIPFLALYIVYKTKLFPIKHTLACAVSLGLSAYYLFPAILERNYIPEVQVEKFQMYPLWEYFTTTWRYGLLFQGNKGELGNSLGYAHWFVVVATIFMIRRKKFTTRMPMLLLLLCFFTYFLFMQEPFKQVWINIQMLRNFQSPHRLLLMCTLLSSTIGGLVVMEINKRLSSKTKPVFLVFFLTFTMLSTILNWGNRRVIANLDDNFIKQIQPSQTDGIFVPKTASYFKNTQVIAQKPIEFIQGSGQITVLSRKVESREYKIKTKEDSLMRENTLYFPGWTLSINGREQKIITNHSVYEGLIVFKLPAGENSITLVFKDTLVRNISELVSLITLVGIVLLIIYQLVKTFMSPLPFTKKIKPVT